MKSYEAADDSGISAVINSIADFMAQIIRFKLTAKVGEMKLLGSRD